MGQDAKRWYTAKVKRVRRLRSLGKHDLAEHEMEAAEHLECEMTPAELEEAKREIAAWAKQEALG